MSEETPNARISVSRDALRADLAEMELRLRLYFDEQLRGKADTVELLRLSALMNQMDSGNFSPALKRSLEDVIEGAITAKTDRGWTKRERLFGVLAVIVMLVSFTFTVYTFTSARLSAPNSIGGR